MTSMIVRRGAVALLALLALAASSCGVHADGAAAAAAANSALPVSWFVLIDAGSTGSRAHVHQYRVDPDRALPIVEESINRKIKPGLSSYAEDPPAASKSIADLLAFIKDTVPRDQHARTPIHVHATAGLRSVTPAQAAAVLDVVRDDLAVSGFLFEPAWARVISGEQEGINGWMAVNYLLGVFDQPAAESDGSSVPPTSTGVVEMGGSSMQITFAPSNPTPEERKQLNEVRVAGHTYSLYTHSFLQYGLQAAEKLYQKLAIQEIEEHGNPCYPPHFRHSSAGDFSKCATLLEAVVDKSIKCASRSCSFNGVYQPVIANEQFLAIENFYYTAKFFGTAEEQDQTREPGEQNAVDSPRSGGNQLTSGLRRKGAEFCNQPWETLTQTYAKTPPEELKAFCFSAAYQSVVLESGLGFGPSANLRVAKTIKGKGIDWEMGATLFELMPKDPATLALEKARAEEEARIRNSIGFDEMTGFATTRGAQAQAQADLRAGDNAGVYCKQCLLYTFLFAIAVVLAYWAYTRYYKRSGGNMLTAYSQAAFNRV